MKIIAKTTVPPARARGMKTSATYGRRGSGTTQNTSIAESLRPREILRWPELHRIIGRSRAQVWRDERDGKFPLRVRTGPNSIGWFSDEVAAWQENLPRAASDRRPEPTP